MAQRESSAAGGGRRAAAALIVALIATATWFRLWHLSSMPGVSGDEGWWGVNAIAWLNGRPYQAQHHRAAIPPISCCSFRWRPSMRWARPRSGCCASCPAAVNLLALPIGFWFVRRIYGSTTAWIYTVALAIAPTAMAHSRICQDPSQTIFWTGFVIYLSLLALVDRTRAIAWLGCALLLFPAALWTHPTNVFISPFLIAPAAVALLPLLPSTRKGRIFTVTAAAFVLALVAIVARPAFFRLAESSDFANRPWLSMAVARIADPAQWLEFAVNTARLFNGVTVYHYFSGARPWTPAYDAGFVLVAVAVLGGLSIARGERAARTLDMSVLVAWAAGLVLFYAFAGPKSLRPSAERWGLWMIVPGTLLVARGTAAWLELRPRLRPAAVAAAGAAAAALLASFYLNFFREFATTGGRSHLTYITAPIEPKQQALQRILSASPGDRPFVIVAREWWLYWPIAYLATPDANVTVTRSLPPDDSGFAAALGSGRVFVVEFANTPELGTAIEWIRSNGLRFTPAVVPDASGRDLLAILQVTRAN